MTPHKLCCQDLCATLEQDMFFSLSSSPTGYFYLTKASTDTAAAVEFCSPHTHAEGRRKKYFPPMLVGILLGAAGLQNKKVKLVRIYCFVTQRTEFVSYKNIRHSSDSQHSRGLLDDAQIGVCSQ